MDGAGNVYITGSVITYEAEETPDNPDPSNADALLTKLDSSGNLLWTQQIGSSSHEYSNAVALDSFDNVFIAGHTKGSYGEPNAYDQDAFLIKLDSSGNTLWSRQLESSSYEYCYSVAVDGYGNAFIAGSTTGDLGGPNAGRSDAYVAKFDGFGNVLWTLQFGTTRSDDARSVAVDDSGNVYIAGDTFGSFGGPNAGSFDMFLLKLSAPDHPTGDVNFDGTVNALDLSILSSNWLQTMPGGPAVGDINTDGTVNALDLSLLAGNWLVGSSDGDVSFDHSLASIGLIGIPEPATAILLCAGGAIMLRRRR